jgi:hypothetical protein
LEFPASHRPNATRPRTQLAARLEKNLSGYATAAAGVGLFALAQPADAKVVFTPSNIPIAANAGLVHLDLNHDGVADFAFYDSFRFGSAREPLGLYAASLLIVPEQAGNEVRALTSSKGFQCAAKLRGKVTVGPGKDFEGKQLMLLEVVGDYTNQFSVHCPWADKKGGFVGFKFLINGETHYGWARIAMFGSKYAAIRGYAYETVPDQPIVTGATSSPDDADASSVPTLPSPASLGALAVGTSALSVWRKIE